MKLNFLASLNDYLAKSFVENIDEEEFVSHPVSLSKQIFAKNSISNYIRPFEYHSKFKIYECNDGYSGVVIEIIPRVRMGKDTIDTFRDIFEGMPDDTYMSVQLFGSKNNSDILNTWNNTHRYRLDASTNYLVNLIYDFYNDKATKNLSSSIKTNLKNHKIVLSIKHRKVKKLREYVEEVFRVLSSGSFSPRYLTPDLLKPFYYEFLNDVEYINDMPKYQKSRHFNKQCVSYDQVFQEENEYIRIGRVENNKFKGSYWNALAIQDISENFEIGEFSQKIGATIGSGADVEGKQFKRDFIISLNITKALPKEVKGISNNQLIIEKTAVSSEEDVDLKEQKKENKSIRHKLGNEDPFFKTDLTVLLSADTLDELKTETSNIKAMWRKNEADDSGRIRLEKANNMHKNIFLSALPLGLNEEYFTHIQDKPYFWSADNVCQFLPVEGDWNGNSPNALGVGRRGGLCGIDTFATSTNKNFYLIGTSGAGKSNLLSWFIFSDHAMGRRNFIIDVGASQEVLVQYLGGDFLQPDLANPISFNPFGNILDLEELKKFGSFFSNWLYVVGGNKDEQTYKKEQKFIKAKLEDVIIQEWIKANAEGRILEPTDVQKEFMNLYDKHKDIRYSDFAIQLTPVCEGGKYEKFFKGKSDFDIKKAIIACLDLTLIQEEEDLRDNLIFVMTFFFSEAIYKGDSDMETSVKIDELQKHLGKDSRIEEEADVAVRTYRKHGAGIGFGTQGFNDLVDAKTGQGTKLGKSIIENSATAFFGKQTNVAKNLLISSEIIDFDEIDKDILSNPPMSGGYKEFLVVDENSNKIPVRFIFPRFFLWLCTTDPKEKPLLKRTIKQFNGNILKAVNYLVDMEEKRSA